MDVGVTGSSGLIGSALVATLRALGHDVRRLVRRPAAGPGEVSWDPVGGTVDAAALAGVDAVVHLAGESIGTRRWTDERKARIRDSRVLGTDLLARTVATLEPRPATLLCASGINYYGDRGDEELTEASRPGSGFLAGVVAEWEAALAPAADAGVRTASLRSGVVLSRSGGALAKMLPLFRLGLGGRMGRGDQWWSWISLDDEVAAIVHLLGADVRGPVNLTSPMPVTNATFTETLARTVRRPAVLAVPRFGPSLLLGRELAGELLFTSARVVPEKLLASGYAFLHPTLGGALAATLGR